MNTRVVQAHLVKVTSSDAGAACSIAQAAMIVIVSANKSPPEFPTRPNFMTFIP